MAVDRARDRSGAGVMSADGHTIERTVANYREQMDRADVTNDPLTCDGHSLPPWP